VLPFLRLGELLCGIVRCVLLWWIGCRGCVQNGVLLRTVLDTVSGELKDTRTRYLGSRPVKLFRIMMQGSEAVSCRLLLNDLQ